MEENSESCSLFYIRKYEKIGLCSR
jgi:hypothetical protein